MLFKLPFGTRFTYFELQATSEDWGLVIDWHPWHHQKHRYNYRGQPLPAL